MANDGNPEAVIAWVPEENAYRYVCAVCAKSVTYPARERAYVWDQIVRHLATTHGLRRTWVETVDARAHQVTQLALSAIFDQTERKRGHAEHR